MIRGWAQGEKRREGLSAIPRRRTLRGKLTGLDKAGRQLRGAIGRLERETGVEPATSTLARWRSTTELHPLREEGAHAAEGAPECQVTAMSAGRDGAKGSARGYAGVRLSRAAA